MPKPLTPEQRMVQESESIYQTEQSRYGDARRIATDAFETSRDALSQTIDPDLLFSRRSDDIAGEFKRTIGGIRSSLGARGINPNSGAAQGMLSRAMFQRENAQTGARRDVELANQQQRQINAATNFANAMNLSNVVNAPASAVRLDTATNLYEGQLAREGMHMMAAAQRQSSKDQKKASTTGSALSILPF